MSSQIDRRVFLAAAAAAGCAHSRSETNIVWEHHMISSGANRPDFNVEAQANTEVLVALHQGQEITAGNEQVVAALRQRGFVKDGPAGPIPAVLLVSLEDGRRWFGVSPRVSAAAARIIVEHLPAVRAAIGNIGNLGNLNWSQAAFFILSDVLLDSWQINTVERRWLGAERPQRSGGRYYYTLMARPAESDLEAFGIYGNQFFNYGDVAIGLYGNRRLAGVRLPSLDTAQLQALFGVGEGDPRAAHAMLARTLANAARGAPVSASERAGFQSLGLMNESGAVCVPVLREADYVALNGIAALIEDDLITALNGERAALAAVYDASPYAVSVSFEEYLIWWYHFFYTNVTDRLAGEGILEIPGGGVTTYIVTE